MTPTLALRAEIVDSVSASFRPTDQTGIATIHPAVLMGAGADLGTVEPGTLAALIVVDGNPLDALMDTPSWTRAAW